MRDLLGKLLKISGLRPSDRQIVERWRAAIDKKPQLFIHLCRSMRIDRLGVRYLARYYITIDVEGGSISEEVLRSGSYQFSLMETIARLVPLDKLLFVNVGANIGTTCLNAHALGARKIVAVEPVARNFSLLETNLKNNGIVARLHNCALGPEKSRASINLHPRSAGRHSLKSTFKGGSSEVIDIEPGDGLGVAEPFFLWIDTEGSEHEVLLGATAALRDHCIGVCIEITPQICGADIAGRTLGLLANEFDRFFEATGEPVAITAVRERVETGAVAQLDLICIDSRKLANFPN